MLRSDSENEAIGETGDGPLESGVLRVASVRIDAARIRSDPDA